MFLFCQSYCGNGMRDLSQGLLTCDSALSLLNFLCLQSTQTPLTAMLLPHTPAALAGPLR